MKLSNTNNFRGEELGLVVGSYSTTKIFYKDFFAGIRNFFGWEMKEYTEAIDDAILEATKRIIAQAKDMGANAIYNIRIESSNITQNGAEIIIYGTAVKLK